MGTDHGSPKRPVGPEAAEELRVAARGTPSVAPGIGHATVEHDRSPGLVIDYRDAAPE